MHCIASDQLVSASKDISKGASHFSKMEGILSAWRNEILGKYCILKISSVAVRRKRTLTFVQAGSRIAAGKKVERKLNISCFEFVVSQTKFNQVMNDDEG